MYIYLIQFQTENGQNLGTPYLTACETTVKRTLEHYKKMGQNLYVHKYEVKTQGKNFSDYAVAQYYDETKEPF